MRYIPFLTLTCFSLSLFANAGHTAPSLIQSSATPSSVKLITVADVNQNADEDIEASDGSQAPISAEGDDAYSGGMYDEAAAEPEAEEASE